MGESVHQSIEHITAKFRFRARLSLAGIGVAGGLGFVGVVATVNEIPGELAVFMGSVAALATAMNMITNWGASDGHAELARLAADGHERLNDTLSEIEQSETQIKEAVVYALDDLRERRRQQEG